MPSTRQTLLDLLLHQKAGLAIEELATTVGISRNAVRQHLASLERDGLVAVGDVRRHVGRPTHVYTLTPMGLEQFPRQYSLLSRLTFSVLRDLHGPEGIKALLHEMATRLASQVAPQVRGESPADRAGALAGLLDRLGYAAGVEVQGEQVSITAVNCVYHHLAREFPEVCALDVDLIEQLSGMKADHTECMVRGGTCCRFRLSNPDP
jgi:DeoR family transcriptional regulator, suf operon transcriptional repressor